MSQEHVDSFIAKIQAQADNVKDMWVQRHLVAQWCHQRNFTLVFRWGSLIFRVYPKVQVPNKSTLIIAQRDLHDNANLSFT